MIEKESRFSASAKSCQNYVLGNSIYASIFCSPRADSLWHCRKLSFHGGFKISNYIRDIHMLMILLKNSYVKNFFLKLFVLKEYFLTSQGFPCATCACAGSGLPHFAHAHSSGHSFYPALRNCLTAGAPYLRSIAARRLAQNAPPEHFAG